MIYTKILLQQCAFKGSVWGAMAAHGRCSKEVLCRLSGAQVQASERLQALCETVKNLRHQALVGLRGLLFIPEFSIHGRHEK